MKKLLLFAALLLVSSIHAQSVFPPSGSTGGGVTSFNTRTGAVSPATGDYSYTQISSTPTLPANTTALTHNFLTAYNSLTGAFTQAQPAFSDLSGSATTAQLPGAGATTVNGTSCVLGSTCTISTGDTTAKYLIGATDATLTNAKVWPTLYNSVDAPPASAGSIDDEFDSGTSVNTGVWTWLGQGSATAPVGNGMLRLQMPNGVDGNVHAIYQTAPGTPWEVECSIVVQEAEGGSGDWHAGLVLYDDLSGKLALWSVADNAGTIGFQYQRWNSTTSWNSSPSSVGVGGIAFVKIYLKAKDDGTNVILSESANGQDFDPIVTESRTAWLTNGPRKVGLFVENSSSGRLLVMSVDYFRRTL